MENKPLYIQTHCLISSDFPYFVSHDVIAGHFALHRHDFIEFFLVIAGTGQERINGREHGLRPGSVSLLLPWHAHDLQADEGATLDMLKCCFSLQVFTEPNGHLSDLGRAFLTGLNAPSHHDFPPEELPGLQAAFEELLEEFKAARPWKQQWMDARLTELLIRFDRVRQQSAPSEPSRGGAWGIVDLINLRYNEPLTLEELSGMFHYSPAHINRLLTQHTGLTFDALLNELRVRNACGLLRILEIPLPALAEHLGYGSPEAFARAFKAIKGMSPEHYRRAHAQAGTWSRSAFSSPIDARVLYYIHCNYREDLTLASLAKTFHYSQGYLSDLFYAHTGGTFAQFLQEVRVYHACALLRGTDHPANEIGFEVGFRSTETFLRAFKRIHGQTPGEYRRNADMVPPAMQ